MKSLLLKIVTICATLAALATTSPSIQQQPLTQVAVMIEPVDMLKVPGNNNATYGPVPKVDQLFQIEFLDIAPSPIPVYGRNIIFLFPNPIDRPTNLNIPVVNINQPLT